MIFDLSKYTDRESFKLRCKAAIDRDEVVSLTVKRPPRSLQQNRYLHLILGMFGIETGNTVDYVKTHYFKRGCNADLFIITNEDALLKCTTEELRSTSDLNTEEMTRAIDRFRRWSLEEGGIYLPEPNEKERLWEIELEIERQKNYL